MLKGILFYPDFRNEDILKLNDCKEQAKQKEIDIDKFFIMINTKDQRLHLLFKKKIVTSYVISTGRNGEGQEEGSGKTPLGWHEIAEKIGQASDKMAIFVSRKDTKKTASFTDEKAYITTRILRLKGLEKGYNLDEDEHGTIVDTFKRYIYIHGTNDVKSLGKKASFGCVRMQPDAIIHLYNKVISAEKIPVYIY